MLTRYFECRNQAKFKVISFKTQIFKNILSWLTNIEEIIERNKKYNCSGHLAFKSQKVQYQSDKKLLHHYCIQKISSIHKFILKMQQIVGSPELKLVGHLWPCPLKNHWINFLLSRTCTSMQNTSLFHQFIFEIQSISESCDQTGHIHFWPCLPKKILISF